MKLVDAHNHLQDECLKPHEAEIVSAAQQNGVFKMVVNGSCEEDWPAVLDLAKRYPDLVIPSFGLHPWYVSERSSGWKTALVGMLDEMPSCLGEIGIDKWILERHASKGSTFSPSAEGAARKSIPSLELQEEAFILQLRVAAERNLPASIHCRKAWGRLLEILQQEPRPDCGFILHSFGGPKEMIPKLNELGAYFSLPGYFAHERKERQRDTFRHVPLDRLLIETDAPDQRLPETREQFPLKDRMGEPINHPANLRAVYEFAAELRSTSLEKVSEAVESNFNRLFGHMRMHFRSS